jgi:hypothetical protein
MPVIDRESVRANKIPDAAKPTGNQFAELNRLLAELATAQPDVDWKAHAREIAGVPGDMLTRTDAETLHGKLNRELAQLAHGEPTAA